MSDKLVFDLSQEIEGSPNVFIRKDWLNILDNQNQNYNNNQSVVDTSQLSNSNKWMNYREAYFSIPMLLTIGATDVTALNGGSNFPFCTSTTATLGAYSIDYAYGLKNWFGSVIHSFTLDYNGTTIIQQTPLSNMWNAFKLMTSLSYNDLLTQGDIIGFYPDDATSWEWAYTNPVSTAPTTAISFKSGTGVCNNTVGGSYGQDVQVDEIAGYNSYNSASGNNGYTRRIQNINFNLNGIPSLLAATLTATGSPTGYVGAPYGALLNGWSSANNATAAAINGTSSTINLIWKSYISACGSNFQQTSIVATVYLKHVHSFFNMVPLLKGVFMKMTMNLNNASSTVYCQSYDTARSSARVTSMICTSVSVATGGINPIMVSAPVSSAVNSASGGINLTQSGSSNLFPTGTATASSCIGYTLNLSIGAVCLNNTLNTSIAASLALGTAGQYGSNGGQLSKSIYLYIPAYTFNPPFEQAYLSSPTKVIKYTDIYQYQVLNIGSGAQFNNLLTNGIANIKSVLILPFFSSSANAGSNISTPAYGAGAGFAPTTTLSSNTGFLSGTPVWQSPFDTAGTGTTSPLVFLTNFNVQISGQNAIYNVEKYAFEQFNNQLHGQNSVNGGLTDGLCSGLIGRTQFDMNYCYYYINVERMLPVEETVPKSVQILGNNLSSRALDFYCFIEYGMEVKIDALTGARV